MASKGKVAEDTQHLNNLPKQEDTVHFVPFLVKQGRKNNEVEMWTYSPLEKKTKCETYRQTALISRQPVTSAVLLLTRLTRYWER